MRWVSLALVGLLAVPVQGQRADTAALHQQIVALNALAKKFAAQRDSLLAHPKHDTIAVTVTTPTRLTGGMVIDSTPGMGHPFLAFRTSLLGSMVRRADGSYLLFKGVGPVPTGPNPSVTVAILPLVATVKTLDSAYAILRAP